MEGDKLAVRQNSSDLECQDLRLCRLGALENRTRLGRRKLSGISRVII